MHRRGATNTLWIAIAGAVMLAAAIFVLQIGADALNTTSDQTGSSATQAEVQQACERLAQQIDSRFCNQYVDNCNNPQSQYSASNNEKGYQADCSLTDWGEVDNLVVQTSEGEFNCYNEGYISDKQCPAND